MRFTPPRFDAPFYGLLVTGVLLVGAFGCIGIAATAQTLAKDNTSIVSQSAPAMIRQGVMTDRVRNESGEVARAEAVR